MFPFSTLAPCYQLDVTFTSAKLTFLKYLVFNDILSSKPINLRR